MLLCLRRGVLAPRARRLADARGPEGGASSVYLSKHCNAKQTVLLDSRSARRVCASFKAQAKGAYRTPRIRFERLAAEV